MSALRRAQMKGKAVSMGCPAAWLAVWPTVCSCLVYFGACKVNYVCVVVSEDS